MLFAIKRDNRLYLLLKACLTAFFAFAAGFQQASGQEVGRPFLTNYGAEDYNANPSNWAVVQDKRGVMYFGNTGVLEFDGARWKQIPIRDVQSVRSLAIDDSTGRIYVGAVGEFGYLEVDDTQELRYVSLSDMLSSKDKNFSDIWSTVVNGDDIYFQDFFKIFHFKKGKIKVIPTPNTYHRMFALDGNVFVRQESRGLCLLKDGRFVPLKNGKMFKQEYISAMVAAPDGKSVIIGSRSMGLFSCIPAINETGGKDYAQATIEPIISKADGFFKKYQIYHAVQAQGGQYVWGSISGGSIVTDKNFNPLRLLDDQFGMEVNSSTFLYFDNQNDVWITTPQGITRAELSSPFSIWDKSLGLKGGVHTATRHEGKLYAATQMGTFYLDTATSRFVPVAGAQTQSWQFASKNTGADGQNKLLLSSAEGLHEISGDQSVLLKGIRSTSVLRPKKQAGIVYLGHSNGLVKMVFRNGVWEEDGQIKGIKGSIMDLTEDAKGNIWAAAVLGNSNSLFRIIPDFNLQDSIDMEQVKHFSEKDLPATRKSFVFDGGLYFGTQKGVYQFDETAAAFKPASNILGSFFPNGKSDIFYAVEDYAGNLWVSGVRDSSALKNRTTLPDKSKRILGYVKKDDKGYLWVDSDFKRIPKTSINSIFPEPDGTVWISAREGLYRYDTKISLDHYSETNVIFNSIHLNGDSLIYHGYETEADKEGNDKRVFPFDFNTITFSFSAISYVESNNNHYKFKLQGFDKYWSDWTKETAKTYTNLPEGDYVFRLQAKNIFEGVSPEISYTFSITPPFYRSNTAYLLYFAGLALLVWLYVKINTRRLEKEKSKLEILIKARTAEISKKNDLLEEQKQAISLQAEEMNTINKEVRSKNSEIEHQHEEILSQRDKLEASFENIKTLGAVGQQITSLLSVESIIETVHENVNKLMNATVFAIGTINPVLARIEYRGCIENGQKLPFHFDSLSDKNRLSVRCYREDKSLIINDYDEYLKDNGIDSPADTGKATASIIYLPLKTGSGHIGVISVQSYEKNAYSDYHIDILQNLAVYAGIALDNAAAYSQISEINKNMLDSIQYAQRIQSSILPDIKTIQKNLPDSFVFFKPRNVVSGDFFFFVEKEDCLLLAAADCTGHGVPGAFMSMIGNAILQQIINEKGLTSPDLILNELHKGIRSALKQEETHNHDGMDIAICTIWPQKRIIEFAGAKNPLFQIRGGEEIFIKGDKMPIGGVQKESERVFSKHLIEITEEPSVFYIYTDGYQDQVGGEEGRKFMNKDFRSLLSGISHLPMPEQKKQIGENLKNWQGNRFKQIDDILVIGFKL